MMINKVILVAIIVIVFILGLFIGFRLNNINRNGGGPDPEVLIPKDLNPIPASCEYDGKTYKNGESFRSTDGCNTCSCHDGKVGCTLIACEEVHY